MSKRKEIRDHWDPEDKAREVSSWLNEKKASDVMAVDVRGSCPITEFLVLCTAQGPRHAKGIASHVIDKAGESDMNLLGVEGQREAQWILVDLNDVLVHIFLPDQRQLYDLEGLWSEGKRLELETDAAE
ncbi:ribosome silencing factor [Desulfohalovibrio reitneri]|uniref:ribosome silencing factor n=1 Tax=Desulfohalovibrio reitneri TaxID=1307759 RepID=UPI0004A77EB5|nr:ribosome silencing factor [Desulfohalovibrio reitneri]